MSLPEPCPTCHDMPGWVRVRYAEGGDPVMEKCPDCLDGYPKEDIERAAKALMEASGRHEWSWDEQMGSRRERLQNQALAAIRAFHTEEDNTP